MAQLIVKIEQLFEIIDLKNKESQQFELGMEQMLQMQKNGDESSISHHESILQS